MDCRPSKGFSLVELVIALSILGLIFAIALPYWQTWLSSFRLNGAQRQIQSEIHNLKMRAAAENVGYQLGFVAGASGYSVQRDSVQVATKALTEGVTIAKAGMISLSPGGTAGANRIRLQNGSGSCKQVVVSATGRVRVCQANNCNVDC